MPASTMPAMRVSQFVLNVTSERPRELLRFYRDTLGLEEEQLVGNGVRAGGAIVTFDHRGAPRGSSHEVQRYLINLVVDDLSAEQARIEAQGVTFIRRKGRESWGAMISTLLDPDGNVVQLTEYTFEGMA